MIRLNVMYAWRFSVCSRCADGLSTQPHSDVPEDDESWPSLASILEFRDRVRTRLNRTYAALETGGLEKRGLPIRRVHRMLWMTFEHEAYHVEVGLLPGYLSSEAKG